MDQKILAIKAMKCAAAELIRVMDSEPELPAEAAWTFDDLGESMADLCDWCDAALDDILYRDVRALDAELGVSVVELVRLYLNASDQPSEGRINALKALRVLAPHVSPTVLRDLVRKVEDRVIS